MSSAVCEYSVGLSLHVGGVVRVTGNLPLLVRVAGGLVADNGGAILEVAYTGRASISVKVVAAVGVDLLPVRSMKLRLLEFSIVYTFSFPTWEMTQS